MTIPCARCGLHRKDPNPGAHLCRDCRYVLKPAEREAWK